MKINDDEKDEEIHQFQVEINDIKEVINKYKKTIGAGPDGFRPYYFIQILSDYRKDSILNKLAAVINLILKGNIPDK